MKICVIGLRGIPDVSGGIETHCEHLLPRLAALRPQDVFNLIGRSAYIGPQPYKFSGIYVLSAPSVPHTYLETISNALIAVFTARFRLKCDALHIHAIGPGLVAPLARLLGLKVVLTHHGDDFNRAKWNGLAKLSLHLGERLGVGCAHAVIAVSPSVTKRLQEKFPNRKGCIHYVPNGADHLVVPESAEAAVIRGRYGLEVGTYNISVGRLVPEKRFDDLIIAHNKAKSGVKLVVVGGGEKAYERRLKALAGPNVIFTGTLGHAEVGALVASSRLFILASSHEGLPIAALEASALGAPILLSDIAANRDLDLPERHYFPVGDIDDLASRLRLDPENLRAPELIKLFNWDRVARETSAVYDTLQRQ